MTIETFQKQIEDIYYTRDAERGVPLTFTWFVEEVGELAKEIRKQPQDMEATARGIRRCFCMARYISKPTRYFLRRMPRKSTQRAARKCKDTPCDC